MRIRFLKSWGQYQDGQIIEPPDGQANEMVRRGVAVPVEEEVCVPEDRNEEYETAVYPKRTKR